MPSPYYTVSLDLGATNAKLAILKTGSKDILCQSRFSTKDFPTRKLLFEKIIQSLEALIVKSGLARSNIYGIGIGVPGPVDFKNGRVYYFPNIPGWKNVPLRKMISSRLDLAVFIDNDVKVMALAESKFGAARGSKNCICLTLGTGVGAALFIDGQLFRGSSSVAGEIGHLPLSLDGPQCNCGGRGCLERFVGNKVVLAKARKAFGSSITLEKLSQLAHRGNKKAISIWQEVGFILGVALSGLINVLNPELVVIGGGLSNAGSVLLQAVRQTVKSRAMAPHAKRVKIVRALLGDSAGLIGAGVLVATELIAKRNKR